MGDANVFLEYVAPSLGCIIAIIMFMSPLKAVLKIKKDQSLGDFNMVPLPVTCANCAAWIAYGYVTKNYFMYPANIPGFLISTFMMFTAYGYADVQTRERVVSIFLSFATVLILLGVFSVHFMDDDEQVQCWGYTCVGILLVFYSAPLSTLAHVVRQRNSSSLYLPSSTAALCNGGLWVAYGLAVGDYFIWGPNLAGVALSVVQIAMKLLIPSRPVAKPETPKASAPNDSPFTPFTADDSAVLLSSARL